MRHIVEYAKSFNLPILDHCEETTLAAGGVMNEGKWSVLLGFNGISGASEELIVARNIILSRMVDWKIHMQHISVKESVDLIRQAAERLVGTHDYSSFVVERKEIEDAVRTIFRIEVHEIGQFCCITFVGNGFLYKMIRCLMGMIEAVGAGVATPDDVSRILKAQDRTLAPETAPANGLFLMKVFYTEEDRENFKFPGLPFLI